MWCTKEQKSNRGGDAMIRFEIKKVFSKSANKIALVLLFAVLLLVSVIAIDKVEYVDQKGNDSTGMKAARNLQKEKNKWSGYLTEDVLSKVITENTKINQSDEYLSKNVSENNKAYAKQQGFSDIRNIINSAFGDFQEYDYYKVDSVKASEVGHLYEKRMTGLKEWLKTDEAKDNFSNAKKQYLIGQYKKLKTPFYYEYADGWKALLECAPSIIMIAVLIIGFLVVGIFSDEFQLKADSIFFTSKLGKGKAIRAKIGAGLAIITMLYWGVMLLYSMIVLTVLGTGGAKCMIQTGFEYWKSFYHLTYFQTYLLTLVGGYFGSLFILTCAMFFSAKTRSTVVAVVIPFVFIFIPSFLTAIPALSNILGLLPDQLLKINEVLKFFNLYQLDGKVAGALPILMIVYFVFFCILLPILYMTYQKTEIK